MMLMGIRTETYKFSPMPTCMEQMQNTLLELRKENERLAKENKKYFDAWCLADGKTK